MYLKSYLLQPLISFDFISIKLINVLNLHTMHKKYADKSIVKLFTLRKKNQIHFPKSPPRCSQIKYLIIF